jgi:hypothetical protein
LLCGQRGGRRQLVGRPRACSRRCAVGAPCHRSRCHLNWRLARRRRQCKAPNIGRACSISRLASSGAAPLRAFAGYLRTVVVLEDGREGSYPCLIIGSRLCDKDDGFR